MKIVRKENVLPEKCPKTDPKFEINKVPEEKFVTNFYESSKGQIITLTKMELLHALGLAFLRHSSVLW